MYKKPPFSSEIFLQIGWVSPLSHTAFLHLPTAKELLSLTTAPLRGHGLSCPMLHRLPKTCPYSLWDALSWSEEAGVSGLLLGLKALESGEEAGEGCVAPYPFYYSPNISQLQPSPSVCLTTC